MDSFQISQVQQQGFKLARAFLSYCRLSVFLPCDLHGFTCQVNPFPNYLVINYGSLSDLGSSPSFLSARSGGLIGAGTFASAPSRNRLGPLPPLRRPAEAKASQAQAVHQLHQSGAGIFLAVGHEIGSRDRQPCRGIDIGGRPSCRCSCWTWKYQQG